jgi:predicted PurR-regulated permease PerM
VVVILGVGVSGAASVITAAGTALERHLPMAVSPPENLAVPRAPAITVALFVLTLGVGVVCFLVVQPFVPVVAWALALAIVAMPIQQRLERRTPPSVAAAIAVLGAAVVVIGPVFFAGQRLVVQAGRAFESLSEYLQSGEWTALLENHPRLGWLQESADLGGLLENVGGFAAQYTPGFVTGSAWAIAQLALTMFFLFFFLRDRGHLLDGVRSVMPLTAGEANVLFGRVRDTVMVTVWANVATSVLQGTLGGLMFWLLGLPAPIVWGFVMFVLSLVPTLGSFVVWAPAALYLALTGSVVKALILVAWGLGPVGLIDNILYPYLVGTRLRLHTLTAFVAVVGGVVAFGAAGLVLGPVAVAIAQALVEIWRRRTRQRRSLASAA